MAQLDNIVDEQNNRCEDLPETSALWVFGYGSLCWQPGFQYTNSLTGYIKGYSRRFWQGNTTHRGTSKKPGRVATLIEDAGSIVWGCAYQVEGDAALPYLNKRECHLGGYLTQFATFYPKKSSSKPFASLLYIATPSNDLWMGEGPLPEIASQIIECSGSSGHNVEYLIRLATFMRDCVPEAVDEHLFALEYLVRLRIKERNLNLDSFMGSTVISYKVDNNVNHGQQAAPPVESFQFTAKVPDKQLRCLKM